MAAELSDRNAMAELEEMDPGRYKNERAAGGKVRNIAGEREFESPQAALRWALGARAAAYGVAREDRSTAVRDAYARIQSELKGCVLPVGEEKAELEALADELTEEGIELGDGSAGGARRRRGTRRGSPGRRTQRGGVRFFKNLYELLKSYCGLGAAAASDVALQDNLEVVVARVNLDMRARDPAQVKALSKKMMDARKKTFAAVATGAVMTNLSRGPNSWIYRLAVLLGETIAAGTPSVAGAATAVKTAGLAVGAVAVPAGQAIALGTATLMAWRAIKYGILGVTTGGMGVASAVKSAVSPGAAALPGPLRYKYPTGSNGPTASQRARAVQKEAKDVLWRYLSGILFGDPERLIKIRDEQGGADRERTAEQLAEIVRQGMEGIRSSAAARSAAERAEAARKAAEDSQTKQRIEEDMARAFMGKGAAPAGKQYFPQVKAGPGMPEPTVSGGILGSSGLGRLSRPAFSAPAPSVSAGELAARTMGANSRYGSKNAAVQADLQKAIEEAKKRATAAGLGSAAAASATDAALMSGRPSKVRRGFSNASTAEAHAAAKGPALPVAAPVQPPPAAAAAPVAMGALGAENDDEEEEGGLGEESNNEGGARRGRRSRRVHRKAQKGRRRAMTKKRGGACGAWRRANSRRNRRH